MDIVLGVSMAPTTVRLVVIEGQDADGVTVDQDEFDVAAADGPATAGAVEQVLASISGTREGAVEGGYRLTSTGVTWTDPAEVRTLQDALAARGINGVMLVAPLLAAAALAQTVGNALRYEHIAMLFVERASATMAVIDVADGSIVDLHRHQVTHSSQEAVTGDLAAMVAGLHTRGSRADGVFLIGCGTDIVPLKPALEAATPLEVTAPEEPDMAMARGAALASANAPLFASSTAALAYALDPGTGEVNPRALHPAYLDVSGNAALSSGALAYSALEDDEDVEIPRRRRPMFLAGSALAAIAAVVAGVVLVSLTSDRPPQSVQNNPRVNIATPGQPLPAQEPSKPPQAQVPPPPAPASPSPAAPPPAAPPTAVAAPPSAPPPEEQPAPEGKPVPAAPVHRAPARSAPQYVPPPVQRAAPAPPPAAPPPPPPAAPPPPPAPRMPPMTMYLHFPFVTVPIPLNPPPPPSG